MFGKRRRFTPPPCAFCSPSAARRRANAGRPRSPSCWSNRVSPRTPDGKRKVEKSPVPLPTARPSCPAAYFLAAGFAGNRNTPTLSPRLHPDSPVLVGRALLPGPAPFGDRRPFLGRNLLVAVDSCRLSACRTPSVVVPRKGATRLLLSTTKSAGLKQNWSFSRLPC
jgi:hypothetical protein